MPLSEIALKALRQNVQYARAKVEENRRQRRNRWLQEAQRLWDKWSSDPLFLLGVGLYWGEGSKSPKSAHLRLSNSDVHLLRVWVAWCRRFLPGLPLYNGINLHPNCDADAARHFWEEQLNIKIGYVWVFCLRSLQAETEHLAERHFKYPGRSRLAGVVHKDDGLAGVGSGPTIHVCAGLIR